MNFHYVYVLENKESGFIYVGQTEDLVLRHKKHNKGEVKSTKPYIPLVLIYYEAYSSKKDALKREKYLKTTKGKTTLKTMLKNYFMN